MRLLGGVKDNVIRGKGGDMKDGDKKEERSGKEVKKVIAKLKNGKTAGIDGILNKVWRY